MKRRLAVVALAIAAASFGLPGRGAVADTWEPRGEEYTAIEVQRDVLITMSDGVRLTADVYLPTGRVDEQPDPARFPVILTQTPYNKNAPGLNFHSEYLVLRGYAQVIVDVRGTGASEGTWDSFGTREQIDGGELADWAATQPFSDGNVALHGTSYGAINQLFTAASPQRHYAIRAMFPIVPMADAYRDITGSGGQLNTSFIPSWLGLVTALGLLPSTGTASDPTDPSTVVRPASVVASHAASAATFQAPAVAKATVGDDNAYDGPFYRVRSPIEAIDRMLYPVPTYLVGGWYDLFQRGTPLLYERMKARWWWWGNPVKLLMGPWYHTEAAIQTDIDLNELELRWFDFWVRQMWDQELYDSAWSEPVSYYRLGESNGELHAASQWPPADVTYGQRFLSGATQPGQAGTLEAQPAQREDPSTVVWHPASGPCSRSVAQWTSSGAHVGCEEDQRVNDIAALNFDLPVAGDPLRLAGPISANLHVQTNDRDAFLTVRLEDVAPDGTSTQISAGWQTLSLAVGGPDRSHPSSYTSWNGLLARPYYPMTRASQVAPGSRIHDIYVEIFPTAAEIASGHSLRLSITPSDSPHLSPHLPGTTQLAGSVLRLYHDADLPSSLILPFQP